MGIIKLQSVVPFLHSLCLLPTQVRSVSKQVCPLYDQDSELIAFHVLNRGRQCGRGWACKFDVKVIEKQ